MIKRFKENPELHPNRLLAGNMSKWTYPEKLAAKWFDKNNIKYEYNKKILSFYPDFIVNNKKTIIEIDGKRWHDKEKDLVRDKKLKSIGYEVIRIDASNVIEKLEEIKNEF